LTAIDILGCVKTSEPDVQLLQAMADPVRLSIVRQLGARPEAVCACDFTECCTVSQPTVSHHLKVLFEAGLLGRERRGRWVYYALREDRLASLRAILAPAPVVPLAV
jgi:ArsR family transcriptional regulator, arsenate/arsenite/antimonite-responsive transcriptional repressor